MRLRIERATRVPPARLYAWWTDFRSGRQDHAWLAANADVDRQVLARSDGWVEIEDSGRFLGMPLVEHYKVHLHPDRHEVALHGANNFSRFSARYRFEEGRAVLDATIAPAGMLAVADVALRPLVRRFLARDLEGHLAEAERDLAEQGSRSVI